MHKVFENFELQKPLNSLFPWEDMENQDNLEFRNLQHFVFTVSQLTQKQQDNCGVSYKNALMGLQRKIPLINEQDRDSIRNLVRSNLHKRGLITEEVYEEFRYASEGTQLGIDVGKYAAGEPDCVITPTRQYIDYFYELFVSVSYPYHITNEEIMKSMTKLLSTVEELERQHIFIKITLVFPCKNPAENKNLFLSIPVFSHKDKKDVRTMSAILNDRLLRKFIFAILENLYGKNLYDSYGQASSLPGAMTLSAEFKEIEFFEEIVAKVGKQ